MLEYQVFGPVSSLLTNAMAILFCSNAAPSSAAEASTCKVTSVFVSELWFYKSPLWYCQRLSDAEASKWTYCPWVAGREAV